MVTLKWCGKQKKGITFVDPNDNLYQEYRQTARESLETLKSIRNKSKVWLAATKYYSEYFAAYALLMKLGIKCEIHECTIAICEFLEKKEIMPKGFAQTLLEDKQLRIDNQYYLKNRDVAVDYDLQLSFILTIEDICQKMSIDTINDLRKELKEKLNKN